MEHSFEYEYGGVGERSTPETPFSVSTTCEGEPVEVGCGYGVQNSTPITERTLFRNSPG